jgi:hypothetical protein
VSFSVGFNHNHTCIERAGGKQEPAMVVVRRTRELGGD